MLLAIDIGNTRTKVAVYENSILNNICIFDTHFLYPEIQKIISSSSLKPEIIISSVGKIRPEDIDNISKISELHIISSSTPVPFDNLYTTPLTLGSDRKVLSAGAVLKFPKTNRLVIDSGTCITYDFITEDNQYLGGAISPGFRLRFKSLNEHTAQLPLLSINENHPLIGNSTENSILSGVINGIINEIDGFIDAYKSKYSTLTVILTGGDSIFLAKRLKNSIFADENFLLESLLLHHQYISK